MNCQCLPRRLQLYFHKPVSDEAGLCLQFLHEEYECAIIRRWTQNHMKQMFVVCIMGLKLSPLGQPHVYSIENNPNLICGDYAVAAPFKMPSNTNSGVIH